MKGIDCKRLRYSLVIIKILKSHEQKKEGWKEQTHKNKKETLSGCGCLKK